MEVKIVAPLNIRLCNGTNIFASIRPPNIFNYPGSAGEQDPNEQKTDRDPEFSMFHERHI